MEITSVKVKKINEENSRLVGAASVVVDKNTNLFAVVPEGVSFNAFSLES